MSGECSFDGDLSRFKVANLTHQDDVRILPQESTQGSGKVQADLLFHLHLIDALQLEFDRVLGGHDVSVGLIQARNRGVQRVGFSRTSWSGHQHHAVGLQDSLLELNQRLGFETQLGHVQPQVFLV